ncbi:MAG: glycosyltransferase [Firmicutes bacterium]|nr:glycosyltransferase [Bacillota bacterium]
MTVSVVVPVYDTEKYLKRCLDSIVNQTFKEIELIIINDGSPDNSRKIILEYVENSPDIVFIDIENKGVSNARNLGLERATGEYIIFVDSDDYLDITAIEKLYNAITYYNADLAVCNFAKVYDDHIEEKYLQMPNKKVINYKEDGDEFIKQTLSFRCSLAICVFNKLFPTKLLRNSGLIFEERCDIYAEDAFFYSKLSSFIKRVCIVDEPLYLYYQRDDSATNAYKPDFVHRVIGFLDGLEAYYDGKHTGSLNERAFIFLPEVLANESLLEDDYKKFKEDISNKALRKWISNVSLKKYSFKNKLLYFLYKTKQYRLLYIVFNKFKKRRKKNDKATS